MDAKPNESQIVVLEGADLSDWWWNRWFRFGSRFVGLVVEPVVPLQRFARLHRNRFGSFDGVPHGRHASRRRRRRRTICTLLRDHCLCDYCELHPLLFHAEGTKDAQLRSGPRPVRGHPGLREHHARGMLIDECSALVRPAFLAWTSKLGQISMQIGNQVPELHTYYWGQSAHPAQLFAVFHEKIGLRRKGGKQDAPHRFRILGG